MKTLSDFGDNNGRVAAIQFAARSNQWGAPQYLTKTPHIAGAAGMTVDRYGNVVAVLTHPTRFAGEQGNDR